MIISSIFEEGLETAAEFIIIIMGDNCLYHSRQLSH